jgi:hypothetical protein
MLNPKGMRFWIQIRATAASPLESDLLPCNKVRVSLFESEVRIESITVECKPSKLTEEWLIWFVGSPKTAVRMSGIRRVEKHDVQFCINDLAIL